MSRKKYEYKMKNKTTNQKFVDICKLSQKDLKAFLNEELAKYYKNVIAQDGFLYAKGKDKVCLTAHMDTVHKELVKEITEWKTVDGNTYITSPQGIGGDDRCGIYMILEILERTKLRPTILFCEDEEIGGIGSTKFVNTKFIEDIKKMYYLIELDRKGNNDLVFYGDVNEDFHKYLEESTGYKESYGSFSDISNLSPACKVSSVNISCGYYKAHTTDEYVNLNEMENSINVVIEMIKKAVKDKKSFEYKKREYKTYNYSDYRFDDGYEYYDSYMSRWLNRRNRWYEEKKNKQILYVYFKEYEEEAEEYYEDEDEMKMWGKFFNEHPSVCFNDIIDYDVFPSEMQEYYGLK